VIAPSSISGIRIGSIVRAVSARVEMTQSEPPLRYTEATLLQDMLHASKLTACESEAAVLKATNGIGTARTRSEGIVDLIRNKTLVREARSVGARPVMVVLLSESGRKLERALPIELKSVALTAKWEMLCRRIERGEVPADHFLTVTRKFVAAVVEDVKKRKSAGQIATTPAGAMQNEGTV